MLAMMGRVSDASIDSMELAADVQPSVILGRAVVHHEGPPELTTRSVGRVDAVQRNAELFGLSALPSAVFQESISGVHNKLKDFTAEIDLWAIGELIVRLNNDCRKAAREDLWAALAADVAAQQSAAKAIRNSGLCQLFAAILTSSGAMVGAGIGIKGARQSQAKFNEGFSANIQKTASRSHSPHEVGNMQSGVRFLRAEAVGRRSQAIRYRLRDERDLLPGRQTPATDALELTRVEKAKTAAQQEAMRFTGLSQIATETAKLFGAGPNMAATHFQEEKGKRDAESTKAKTWTENEREFIGHYETVLQDVLSKLEAIRNADREARNKLVSMS